MTSSVAGSVGTATESNYTAANSFMENFLKYRCKHNLPATSIGLGAISEVGYLHENPEIEAVLLRKGITPIKEEELLSIIDITLSRPDGLEPTEAHVLTGLETQGMKKLRRMGFEGTIPTLNDPRASILASSLDGETDLHSKKTDSGLPPALAATLEAGGDADAVLDTLTDIILGRLANLILVPAGKIDHEMPLIKWGMDSMLAAEYRTWFLLEYDATSLSGVPSDHPCTPVSLIYAQHYCTIYMALRPPEIEQFLWPPSIPTVFHGIRSGYSVFVSIGGCGYAEGVERDGFEGYACRGEVLG